MSRTALLIIDVQAGLFKLKKPIYKPEQLLKNINKLETSARKSNSIIIYIQHENYSALKYGKSDWERKG